MKSPTTPAHSVRVLTTSVVRPWESTSESASTSDVSRAMIQPAFCCEKYFSDSVVRWSKRSSRSPSTTSWPTRGEAADQGRLEDPGESVDQEVDHDVASQSRLVVRLHAVVDRVLDDEQRGDGGRRGADADQREQPDAQPVAGEIAGQPGQPDALLMRRH